jgi:hypothetical protein
MSSMKDAARILSLLGSGAQIAGDVAEGSLSIATSVSNLNQAKYLEEAGDISARIAELQQMIKALQQIVDQLLSGAQSASEWVNSVFDQLQNIFNVLSQGQTELANAGSGRA